MSNGKVTALKQEPQQEARPQPVKRNKSHVIRQDRGTIEDLRYFLILDGQSYPVINYSTFGLAIYSEQPLEKDLTRNGCRLVIEDIDVGEADIRKVRHEALETGGFKNGFEVIGQPLNIDRISIFPEIWKIVASIASEHEKLDRLPIEFVASVFSLKDSLSKLERKIEELQTGQDFLSRAQVEDFETTVIAVAGKAIHQTWQSEHSVLSKSLEGKPDEMVKAAFHFFREQMKGLLYQSPFANRTFQKPRGYAGDFEMMNLIYRNQDMGTSLFGRCVERSFLVCPEPEAVRNRAGYLIEKITALMRAKPTGTVRILSVASGPAVEIQKLLGSISREDAARLEVSLLDQDQGSLKYAQKQIKTIATREGKPIQLRLVNQTIKEIIQGGLEEEPFDLVYSAGLFDYFTDSVAHAAARVLIGSVKPGAELVIGNFDISTPNRFTMSLVFDWNLMYRSQSDLERLFKLPAVSTRIEKEEVGVNLFCVLKKEGG